MFTGIIENLGTIENRTDTTLSVAVPKKLRPRIKLGASVAVNGTCLTVKKKTTNGFVADVMPETWNCTSLCGLHKGCLVNLELSLRLSDGLDGHIVQGHVDGLATLTKIKEEKESKVLTFSSNKNITEYLVKKGTIVLNGIALTLVSVTKDSFSVSIIPHTWEVTMLHKLGVGDSVNVEIDIISKYIKKYVSKK